MTLKKYVDIIIFTTGFP